MNKEELTKEDILNVTGSIFETMLDYADNSNKEIEQLQQENKQLKDEIKAYQDMYFDKIVIINKAIEYIENNSYYYNADGEIMFVIEEENEENFCKDVLEILKGEDNE